MIFQTYYLPEHVPFLLDHRHYRPICVHPQHFAAPPDPDIRVVEAIRPVWVRQQLCEYAAIIAVWKLGLAGDWIGFTSWRQLHKGYSFVIDDPHAQLVARGAVLTWGRRDFETTSHLHAEAHHPGISGVLAVLLRDIHGLDLPSRYYRDSSAYCCNYWAMPAALFNDYMTWSFPIVESALTRWGDRQPFNQHTGDPQTTGGNRSLAFLQERLFGLWLHIRDFAPIDCSPAGANQRGGAAR